MFCAKCGKEIDNDSTFCLFCGQKVGEPVINKKGIHPPASMKKISITKLVMGIAGCLVILSGVVLGIIKFTGGSNTKETAEGRRYCGDGYRVFRIRSFCPGFG